MSTPIDSYNDALNILPKEAATELRQYAEMRCRLCARTVNKRRVRNLDETDAASDATRHFDSFKKICEGFLSEPTCKDIKSMLKCAGFYLAKIRKGEKCLMPWNRQFHAFEAEEDKQKMEKYCRDAIDKREISETLANNIKKLGLTAAWVAVYSIFGPEEEEKRQMTQLDTDFERIHGEVNLVNMKFVMDEARILSDRPILVSERNMENESDVQQTMNFSFSVTEGRTHSTTHTVNFSYGIGATFSAGFAGIGEINCQLSFNFSHNHSFKECINTAKTESYEFPQVVPAHSVQVATATVHEAQMQIPYELMFDFGGATRSVKGLWKGVACSKATYKIETIKGPSPPDPPDEPDPPVKPVPPVEPGPYCLIF